MSKELIEQIKQIKGVKTVIPSGETCVVTFEPEEKTLADYEMILLNPIGKDNPIVSAYQWLKLADHKIYWLKVLSLIADDLNEKYEQEGYCHIEFNKNFGCPEAKPRANCGVTPGEVIFYSVDAAKTAIRIMGDSLKFLNGK